MILIVSSQLNLKQSYEESKADTIIIFYREETKAQRFYQSQKTSKDRSLNFLGQSIFTL